MVSNSVTKKVMERSDYLNDFFTIFLYKNQYNLLFSDYFYDYIYISIF